MLTVELNNIDRNNVLLGDNNCKPNWSNETHAQFITHIDNCSLVLNICFFLGEIISFKLKTIKYEDFN
jgi:hypothetical protein